MTTQTTNQQEQTLTNSVYANGINMDILQGTVHAIEQEPALGQCKFRARNTWLGGNHNSSTITGFYGAKQEIAHKQAFVLHADEPPLLAGGDEGANPVEYLLNALAACVTTSMVAHAAVRGIHIEELESEIEGDIDLRGFLGLSNDVPKGFSDIRVSFKVKADVDNMERLKKLTEYSPVFNTITQGANVDIQVEAK
ncbi:OsmC family protein [Nitrosococcus wardiae]|uniref:OsmC family peroxiredoxin n=1 Tax=Nitrosococcus wardiae TaxID=1814290 RepID=A0A4P7BVK3_9GAMM|nr:OsmC family protein [Nitrosococcus wardiae]QBQ54053.1 OsmC family peroxiredoxin [Nitrosococcus wardiae]